MSEVSFIRYNCINKILERLITYLMFKFSDGVVNYFYSDSKCTECGICEKICPSNKIFIENNEWFWYDGVKYYLCYGCLNFNPNQSI
ncbi:MAG: hypothetical protein BAJALOKI2v1_140058 [Promethearchaeota archaeon]|nr:MAG: hypothetical protein BAJALOKI2v1_140058 [Candidatus Lokiarchaeota archaeon]